MPRDLADGETTEIQGSGKKPYVIKNVGGVYSCSCPAWRNQSLSISIRTCKHIRGLRGDEAEQKRIGAAELAPSVVKAKEGVTPPPLLLANTWDDSVDPTGWWMSEKLDGVRAFWDGKQFLSRLGNEFLAPKWFTKYLPIVPLDGELWSGRKQFQKTVSVVRRQDAGEQWKAVKFVVFDAPAVPAAFEMRQEAIKKLLSGSGSPYAYQHPQKIVTNLSHLIVELGKVEAIGGEGIMLRKPESQYEVGRSNTLLKVKSFFDDDATVVGYQDGKGKHAGKVGALMVKMSNGTEFEIGTGLSDAERDKPPVVGSVVKFKYQELTDAGVPRFPSYLGLREE